MKDGETKNRRAEEEDAEAAAAVHVVVAALQSMSHLQSSDGFFEGGRKRGRGG
jgi:hypothetical protein